MKRSAIWGVLALVIAVLGVSLPMQAQGGKAVFEASLVHGLFPTPSELSFIKGTVKVYADRTVEVSIVGAQPYEISEVYGGILLAYSVGGVEGDIISWAPVAAGNNTTLQLTTDAKGKGTASRWLGVPEHDVYVVFALNDLDNEEETFGPNRYLAGVRYSPYFP